MERADERSTNNTMAPPRWASASQVRFTFHVSSVRCPQALLGAKIPCPHAGAGHCCNPILCHAVQSVHHGAGSHMGSCNTSLLCKHQQPWQGMRTGQHPSTCSLRLQQSQACHASHGHPLRARRNSPPSPSSSPGTSSPSSSASPPSSYSSAASSSSNCDSHRHKKESEVSHGQAGVTGSFPRQ